VWQAQSVESDGKAAGKKDVERMKFAFTDDKLIISGNYKDDDREMECTYRIVTSSSPKHLDWNTPDDTATVRAIFDLNDGKLTICARHASSKEGRPKEFATKPNSQLILIVLTKTK
jgi:uncharacterized protein (TIGR03067 family)